MTPANDNKQPFTVALAGPTLAELNGMIVKLQRSLEPNSAPGNWTVRYDGKNADGWATATLMKRRGARRTQ